MGRAFGYDGKPGTCLWCGRKFREKCFERDQPAEVGKPLDNRRAGARTLIVRKVVGVTRSFTVAPEGYKIWSSRERPVRDGETPTRYRIYFDPPLWNAFYDDEPLFDTNGCAADFGLRQAQLGRRLVRTPTATPDPDWDKDTTD